MSDAEMATIRAEVIEEMYVAECVTRAGMPKAKQPAHRPYRLQVGSKILGAFTTFPLALRAGQDSTEATFTVIHAPKRGPETVAMEFTRATEAQPFAAWPIKRWSA